MGLTRMDPDEEAAMRTGFRDGLAGRKAADMSYTYDDLAKIYAEAYADGLKEAEISCERSGRRS